jgi:hypothetical protein
VSAALQINKAISKSPVTAAAFLAAIIVESRPSLTFKGATAMINNVNAAAAQRDKAITAKRKADEQSFGERAPEQEAGGRRRD